MLMDVFIKGDVYIDYCCRDAATTTCNRPTSTVENKKEIGRPPKVDFGK